MELLRANRIQFKYETQADLLFDGLSFGLDTDARAGLIGDNGCGKTTLLDILTGRLEPTGGAVSIREGAVVGRLPQEVRFDQRLTVRDYIWKARPRLLDIKESMAATDESSTAYADLTARYYDRGGGQFEAAIERIVAGFGLDGHLLEMPLATLSGGEKTKTALARLLLTEPDILLLDEPTNHLEIASLEWLENYLSHLSIPYLVVSHDRRFLDRCTNQIWELADRKLTVYSGNYSFYRTEKDRAFRRQQAAYEHTRDEVARLKSAARQRRAGSRQAEDFKPARSISKSGSIQKRDAGSGRSRAGGSQRQMKSARALEKRIDRLSDADNAQKPFVEKDRRIDLGRREIAPRVILAVEQLGKRFDQQEILGSVDLTVISGAKIGIIGCNGSGKTTLLRILAGEMEPSSGSYRWTPQARIGYYSQEHETLDQNRSILDEVLQGRLQEQTMARTILGRMGLRRDKVHQVIESLSMGERSKTALAKILFSDANVLVFDEPTNHLELGAREAFEEALEAFSGTVLLASHDRFLLERITTGILDIDRGIQYDGGYSEYMEAGS